MVEWTPWEKVKGFDFEEILYEKKYRVQGGGVGRLTFNRPERMNSFTSKGISEMSIGLFDASKGNTLGVIVMTGIGDNFGTGGDVRWEASGGLQDVFGGGGAGPDSALRCCRKPIIAAVKGYCIGGSHHIAYFCDLTIAADNSIFGQTGPRVGSPAQGYIVSYLTHVVGAKKAREIWYMTRQYTAQEALQLGLVNAVVPLEKLDEEVDKWCDDLLDKCPTILMFQKASFEAIYDHMDGDFTRYLARMAPDFFESGEPQEAQAAYFEKRTPDHWKNRLPDFLKKT